MAARMTACFLQIRKGGELVCALREGGGFVWGTTLLRCCDERVPGPGAVVSPRRHPVALVNCPKCLEAVSRLVQSQPDPEGPR